MPSPAELTDRLKRLAGELGFALCGVTRAEAPAGATRFDEWLGAGYAGQMDYLADRRDAYHDPQLVLEGARSVLVLALPYRTEAPAEPRPGEGRVSCYAWGDRDYHSIIRDKLHQLADELRRLAPHAATRCVVDTAPILERDFARAAGLGWVGKNTLLINKSAGSYFFLAGVLTDAELAYDQPFAADHCGSCTACLDACPTDAFPVPYVLDARRCISYLTIELRDHTPAELREGVGDWLFGCDVCQQVCPWNTKGPIAVDGDFSPTEGMNPIDLAPLFDMNDAEFRQRFRQTPLWRSHREGLLRNAALVLGNYPTPKALRALVKGLNDEHPTVRAACAWALGHYSEAAAHEALTQRQAAEHDERVREELAASLARRPKTTS